MRRWHSVTVLCTMAWFFTVRWMPPTEDIIRLGKEDPRAWFVDASCTTNVLTVADTPAGRKYFPLVRKQVEEMATAHCKREMQKNTTKGD